MSKKIFRSVMAVTMIVFLAVFFTASGFLYNYFVKLQVSRLKDELSIVTASVNDEGVKYFEKFNSSVFRLTMISPDGEVLYDTQADAENMENHLNRDEVSEALKYGRGSSDRYSSTLTERTFYEAVKLDNGDILRISVSQASVGGLLLGMLPAIIAIFIIAVIIALILSHRMAKNIVKPLNSINLDNPEENDTYEELTPILEKLSKQHKQITWQVHELKRRSDEFKQITDSMNEGLVILDKNGIVLSINGAAKNLFETDDSVIGRDFLVVNRSPEMNEAVKKALNGGKHSEFRKEAGGKEYQFMVNRTESEGETIGVVILCFDITEMVFAERNRKEFTANVSHELKTPLQSIIGSAELLENDLVKPEDTKKFIGNIKKEASRLVSLINDIIRLSQLDENNEVPKEPVDVYGVANEVVEILSQAAEKKNVDISLRGEHCIINGVRRYIYEIIYNLCDNAIRYNKDGGSVIIDVKSDNDDAILSVSDTGIGIPIEHQGRIFERFYRADKSHSKETGGTGLGLSIVKHATAYHDGSIKLESKSGEGTTVTIKLQKD
ncbi:MAG: ATP-binding protein [Lachnospiraceae bacterium]|nr:ATP-binding protein [Lachnospiraceae bacterium]MDY2956402.1 ATP-binding protein [Lachnospiraceae bacterium]